jgi:ATP-dependent RNA helicase DDX5/DBP2
LVNRAPGRRGTEGTSYTFFTPKNGWKATDLIKVLVEAKQIVNPKLAELAQAGGGGQRFAGRGQKW